MTMKMRKFFAIVLTIVMVASMLATGAFATEGSAGKPAFRGDEIKAKAGDTITYNVYIDNNPGIAGYKVQVDFSDDAFDLVEQDEDEYENTIEIEQGDFSTKNKSWGNVVSNTTAYGCVALWFNTENVTNDGIAFKVILKVADDAINGEHAVKIRCDAINTVDVDGNLVAFETIDGSVTVSGGVDGTINNDEVGPSKEELEQMESGVLSVQGNPIEEDEPVVNNGEANTDVEASNPMNVKDDNANEDIDSPANDDAPEKEGGFNVVTLILIIAGAIVAIVVVALVIVKSKAKKAKDVIGVIPGNDDREMEIEEVMGWDDAEEDEDDED